jgi:hypothetical protein
VWTEFCNVFVPSVLYVNLNFLPLLLFNLYILINSCGDVFLYELAAVQLAKKSQALWNDYHVAHNTTKLRPHTQDQTQYTWPTVKEHGHHRDSQQDFN